MSDAWPWRRHFLAFAPDVAARAALAAIPVPDGFRAVAPADLHATLVFLDTLDAAGEARALGAARDAAREVKQPLEVRLVRVERWASTRVACDDGEESGGSGGVVGRFAVALREALRAAGFGVEERPFRAHVTLARVRERPAARRDAALPMPVRFAAAEVLLMASLGGASAGTPRYHVRGRVALL